MTRLMKKDKVYTASEVAKLFGVEHMTVRRWIKKLNLDVKKNGNEWQFKTKHIEKIKQYRLEMLKKYYGDVLEMSVIENKDTFNKW